MKSKPTVVVINIERGAILTEIEPSSKAMIANFDVSEEVIFGFNFLKIFTNRNASNRISFYRKSCIGTKGRSSIRFRKSFI